MNVNWLGVWNGLNYKMVLKIEIKFAWTLKYEMVLKIGVKFAWNLKYEMFKNSGKFWSMKWC